MSLPRQLPALPHSDRRRLLIGTTLALGAAAGSRMLGAPEPVATASSTRREAEVLVDDFGAIGDGTADETGAFDRAIAAMPHGGRLVLTGGSVYRTRGGHRLPIGTTIMAAGAVVQHTGDSTCFDFNHGGEFTLDRPSGVRGIALHGGPGSNAIGIEVGNCWGWHIDGSIRGYANGVALSFDNRTRWTEGIDVDDLIISDSHTGVRFRRSSGDFSFGYSRIRHLAINVPPGGVGLDIGSDSRELVYFYNSDIEANIWPTGTDATALRIGPTVNSDNLRLHIVGEVPNAGQYERVFGVRNDGGALKGYGHLHFKGTTDVLDKGVTRVLAGGRGVDSFSGSDGTTSFRTWLTANEDLTYNASIGVVEGPDLSTPFVAGYGANDALRAYSTPFNARLPAATLVTRVTSDGQLRFGAGAATALIARPGEPETAIGGPAGSLLLRPDGAAAGEPALYVKTSPEADPTGWVEVPHVRVADVEHRPAPRAGTSYFDSTSGRPMWSAGSDRPWTDATGVAEPVRVAQGSCTMEATDSIVILKGDDGSAVLPATEAADVGRVYVIKSAGTGNRVGTGDLLTLIDDSLQVELNRWEVLRVATDGKQWYAV